MGMISNEDLDLARALMPDLTLDVIAEKLEVPLHSLAQEVLDCDFYMDEGLFRKRLNRGGIRLQDGAIEKCCPRCEEYMPYTREFWHVAKRAKDGAHSMCRFCEHGRKASLRLKLGHVPRKKLVGE